MHHCPYCELKFQYVTEVRDHVCVDHTSHSASFAKMEWASEAEVHSHHDLATRMDRPR